MRIIQYLAAFFATATVTTAFALSSGLRLGSSLSFVKRIRGGAIDATTVTTAPTVDHDEDENKRLLAEELKHCGGEIIDTHLHTAPWFSTGPELVEELEGNSVSIGILYNPYPKMTLADDVNTYVHSIASNSNKKVYMLASMNMTHDNWAEHRDEEMTRLKNFLEKDDLGKSYLYLLLFVC
jgi:hypothetical protein